VNFFVIAKANFLATKENAQKTTLPDKTICHFWKRGFKRVK